MATVFTGVPHRHWHNGALVYSKQGKAVMALMGKAMDAGKAVDFTLNKPVDPEISAINGPSRKPANGTVYDTINLTITD